MKKLTAIIICVMLTLISIAQPLPEERPDVAIGDSPVSLSTATLFLLICGVAYVMKKNHHHSKEEN
ncbi:MAG: hypothetical protein LBR28_00775 [Bacteroidales bacterium]|jgi:hypothetical protein|nr:hypothetical protein [Bacteroidales bacterium]